MPLCLGFHQQLSSQDGLPGLITAVRNWALNATPAHRLEIQTGEVALLEKPHHGKRNPGYLDDEGT